jgi:RHS repeat-associated protein
VKKSVSGSTTVYIGQTYECTNSQCTKYIISGTQIVAQISAAGTYYYHSDHLGSSSIITAGNDVAGKQAGDQIEDIFYYPYGENQTNYGEVNVRYKYTGKELDSEDGLYYYGARYYDPKLARFISADTIVPMPFYPQSLNRYSYVRNNPLSYTDDSGHYWEETDSGYEEYSGPSTEANTGRDQYLSYIYSTTASNPYALGYLSSTPYSYSITSTYDFTSISTYNITSVPTYVNSGSSGTGLYPEYTQVCIQNYLQENYGNFVANTLVPEFSGISIFTNTADWLKGAVISGAAKGAIVSLPWLAGKLATTTGNNLAAYPGMAGAAADALEVGAFWATTTATVRATGLYGIGAVGVFSTAVDAQARWECWDE